MAAKTNFERMQEILNKVVPLMGGKHRNMDISMHFDRRNKEFLVATIRKGKLEKDPKYISFNFYEWQSDQVHENTLNQLKSFLS